MDIFYPSLISLILPIKLWRRAADNTSSLSSNSSLFAAYYNQVLIFPSRASNPLTVSCSHPSIHFSCTWLDWVILPSYSTFFSWLWAPPFLEFPPALLIALCWLFVLCFPLNWGMFPNSVLAPSSSLSSLPLWQISTQGFIYHWFVDDLHIHNPHPNRTSCLPSPLGCLFLPVFM